MERMNVQATVRAYLAKQLPNTTVKVTVPDPRPDYLVVVRRIGGAMQNELLDFAKVECLIYAPSEAKAADLAAQVSQAMLSLKHADGYALVHEQYFYSDYDTEAKTPRWYAQYELTTYSPKE